MSQPELRYGTEIATLEGILESTGDHVFAVDREGLYTCFNSSHASAMKAMFGVEIELGRSILRYPTIQRDLESARENLARALRGERFTVEVAAGDPGLSRTCLEISHNPIRSADGTVTGVAVFAKDVTERKRTEERLEDARAFQEAIFEGSRDAIFITDGDSRLTAVNTAASELTGYTRAELLTMRIPDLHESADLHAYHTYHDQIMGGDEALTEAKILRKDGRKVDAEFNNRRIVVRGVSHMHTTARDITERKRAETEITRLNADLEKRVLERTGALLAANKDLEAFSHSISHDLRAPVRAVIGFSRSLEERCDSKLDDEGRRLLRVIRKNADRIWKLIDDLLVLSRAGRVNLRKVRFDVRSLVEQVSREVLPEAERDRTGVLVADLPEVCADPNLVRQVFLNLLSNAVKFSSSRQDRVIEIGCRTGAEGHEFFVRDNGAGFDPRYADKLFRPFQRLHGENEFEGTGIGLAVVKRIVERHGGRVWAEGAVDRGATFWFTLGTDS